ncbi:MAG TPA: dihydroneopterin aldolase [Bacteroidia bacterium]|nr:dihydroneopterin aldolase [Bacteroidia bacterium]
MGIINVNGIRVYAYHGCLPEETKIGGEYVVDVSIETDFSKAAESDDLSETVDYCTVNEIVRTEMTLPSKLIEHVAKRIADHLRKKFPAVKLFRVTVTKINPPMNGAVDSVSVVVEG